MPPPAERGCCGDCKFFDKHNVKGNPFGNVRLTSGGRGEGGVCRTDRGLVLGMRSPDTPCTQPRGKFTPKDVDVKNRSITPAVVIFTSSG